MGDTEFSIKFNGYYADKHIVDMRQLGHSLIGFERLISIGLFALSERRFPKQRERVPLVVHAHEPKQGSVEIFGDLGPLAGMLPLLNEAISTGAGEVVWRWVSWVLLMAGGREKEADPHFRALMDLTVKIDASRAESEERQQKFLLEVLEKSLSFARDSVAPIGPSCNTATISVGRGITEKSTSIDVPVADAVRSKEKIEVGDMQQMRVHVDGFFHHNKQLKVVNPEDPGHYISAQVRDPAFESLPNVYTEAAGRNGWLLVTCKPTYKQGKLHGLYIMDAETVSDDPQESP